jgi:hypothetical protein
VNSGPESVEVPLPHSSGIFEGSCERTVNLDHPLYSSDVSHKGHTKAKFSQDVKLIRVFHIVISRGLIERYDYKRHIHLVDVVYGICDEMGVGVNTSVGYTVNLIGDDDH